MSRFTPEGRSAPGPALLSGVICPREKTGMSEGHPKPKTRRIKFFQGLRAASVGRPTAQLLHGPDDPEVPFAGPLLAKQAPGSVKHRLPAKVDEGPDLRKRPSWKIPISPSLIPWRKKPVGGHAHKIPRGQSIGRTAWDRRKPLAPGTDTGAGWPQSSGPNVRLPRPSRKTRRGREANPKSGTNSNCRPTPAADGARMRGGLRRAPLSSQLRKAWAGISVHSPGLGASDPRAAVAMARPGWAGRPRGSWKERQTLDTLGLPGSPANTRPKAPGRPEPRRPRPPELPTTGQGDRRANKSRPFLCRGQTPPPTAATNCRLPLR